MYNQIQLFYWIRVYVEQRRANAGIVIHKGRRLFSRALYLERQMQRTGLHHRTVPTFLPMSGEARGVNGEFANLLDDLIGFDRGWEEFEGIEGYRILQKVWREIGRRPPEGWSAWSTQRESFFLSTRNLIKQRGEKYPRIRLVEA